MIETEKKSCRELLMHRMLRAIVYSVAIQFLLVCCLVLLANLSTDYAYWLRTTWSTFMSSYMWMYLFILAMSTFLQGYLCSKLYLCYPTYYKSRFAKLCASITMQNFLLSASYIVIGGALVWLYMSLIGGKLSTPSLECSKAEGMCLAERYYFLLLSGCWGGLYYSIKRSHIILGFFCFPIIAQSKFSRLRRSIYADLPTLLCSSMLSAVCYIIIYCIVRPYYHAALTAVLAPMEPSEAMDYSLSLLNLLMLVQLWLHQFLFALTIILTYHLFEIYMTEGICFKIGISGTLGKDEPEVTLADAISMKNVPIIQHLGYLDLLTVAQKEKERRAFLFTLSQPGGHPYNWDSVMVTSMYLLEDFTLELDAEYMKQQDRTLHSAPTLKTTVTSNNDYLCRMRKLVQDIPPPTKTDDADAKEPVYSGWFVQKFAKQKRDALVAYLLSKPLINYIFGEQEVERIHYAMFKGQMAIWAADAMSSLTVSSLTEDSFGIVQNEVSTIMNFVLRLKQVLDKLHKSNMVPRKPPGEKRLTRDTFLSLRSAMKRSLYRIITNFQPYMGGLGVKPEKSDLHNYFNYKE